MLVTKFTHFWKYYMKGILFVIFLKFTITNVSKDFIELRFIMFFLIHEVY